MEVHYLLFISMSQIIRKKGLFFKNLTPKHRPILELPIYLTREVSNCIFFIWSYILLNMQNNVLKLCMCNSAEVTAIDCECVCGNAKFVAPVGSVVSGVSQKWGKTLYLSHSTNSKKRDEMNLKLWIYCNVIYLFFFKCFLQHFNVSVPTVVHYWYLLFQCNTKL